MKPIYEPKGRAKEYGDLAINIYTGCNHGCYYCYSPKVLHTDLENFIKVETRAGVVDAVKRQLSKGDIQGEKIHLCFTCDPYPAEIDTSPTREIIKAIKESGNYVQILTKGGTRAERDFDLLDENDWFGVTYTGYKSGTIFQISDAEPNAAPPFERLMSLRDAHNLGIKTWISCEPVLHQYDIYRIIMEINYIDLYKIGKLNYYPSEIDWSLFGHRSENLFKAFNRNYYIKEDLRLQMEREDKA